MMILNNDFNQLHVVISVQPILNLKEHKMLFKMSMVEKDF